MSKVTLYIIRFANDNPSWGYDRIEDALKSTGYHISKTTASDVPNDHELEGEAGSALAIRYFTSSSFNDSPRFQENASRPRTRQPARAGSTPHRAHRATGLERNPTRFSIGYNLQKEKGPAIFRKSLMCLW